MKWKRTILLAGTIVAVMGISGGAIYYRYFKLVNPQSCGECVQKARMESSMFHKQVKHFIYLEKTLRNKDTRKSYTTKMIRPENYEIACALPPRRIEDNQLDKPVPPSSCHDQVPDPLPDEDDKDILSSAEAVGALIVIPKNCEPNCGVGEFWGTGFMIADHVFAMTCHTVQPLLRMNNGMRKFDDQYKLVVRFHDGGSTEFSVEENSEVKCSDQEGLDVALFRILDNNDHGAPPKQLPVFSGEPSRVINKKGEQAATIGYADLLHFVDQKAEEFYHCYEIHSDKPCGNQEYDHLKFALMDWIGQSETCDNNLKILPSVADTTLGESGSPVIRFRHGQNLEEAMRALSHESVSPLKETLSPGIPLVLGIHTCCSEYFPDDDNRYPDAAPQYEDIYNTLTKTEAAAFSPRLQCGHLRRTIHNQAVSIYSILQDPKLCGFLQENGGVDARNWDGTMTTITCNPLTATRQDQSVPSSH